MLFISTAIISVSSWTLSITSITLSRFSSDVVASSLMSLLTSLKPSPNSPILIASTAPFIERAAV